jgi:hypothetical protein
MVEGVKKRMDAAGQHVGVFGATMYRRMIDLTCTATQAYQKLHGVNGATCVRVCAIKCLSPYSLAIACLIPHHKM